MTGLCIAGQLRYIHYVRESSVAGLLSEMHSFLWLLDFHGQKMEPEAEHMLDIRDVLGFSILGIQAPFLLLPLSHGGLKTSCPRGQMG